MTCIIFLGELEKCCFKKHLSNVVKKPLTICVGMYTKLTSHQNKQNETTHLDQVEYCYPSSTLKHNNFSVVSYPHVSKYKTRVLKSCSQLTVRLELKCAICHYSTTIPSQQTHLLSTLLTTFHVHMAWICHYQTQNSFTNSLARFMSHCFEPTQGYWDMSDAKTITCIPDIHKDKVSKSLKKTPQKCVLVLFWISTLSVQIDACYS